MVKSNGNKIQVNKKVNTHLSMNFYFKILLLLLLLKVLFKLIFIQNNLHLNLHLHFKSVTCADPTSRIPASRRTSPTRTALPATSPRSESNSSPSSAHHLAVARFTLHEPQSRSLTWDPPFSIGKPPETATVLRRRPVRARTVSPCRAHRELIAGHLRPPPRHRTPTTRSAISQRT